LKEFEKREQNVEFKSRNIDYIKQTEDLFINTIEEDNLKVIEDAAQAVGAEYKR